MLDAKVKDTLKSMIKGSAIYNVVLFVVSLIVFIVYCNIKKISISDSFIFIVKNELGLIFGFVWSAISMYIMAMSLDKALSSKDSNYAKSHVGLISVVRLIIFCILLVIIINENILGFAGGAMFVFASLGTKIGTYLVPFIEKKSRGV